MLPLAALSRCARRTPVFLDPFCCPRARFTSSVANPQPLIGMLNADLDALPMRISTVTLEGRFTTKLEKIWENMSQWFIKRTFQPSVIRKRRKQGFLTRQKTVGGRRVLKRRLLKGRKRLGGC